MQMRGLQKAHAPARQASAPCFHARAWQQPWPATTAWSSSRRAAAPAQRRGRELRLRVQSQATTGTNINMPSRPGEQIAWGNYMSRALTLRSAVREAATKVLASLNGAQPTLAIVFVSSLHGQDFEQVIPLLKEMVPSLQHVFGCSGYGIVGGGPEGPEEAEGEPSFSLTLGSIPGADIQVLHTLRSSIPAPDATPEEWADFVGVPHDTARPVSFLTFADPRFAQVRDMVAGLDYAFPNSPKIGAILSSGTRSRSRAMFAWSAKPHTRKQQWPWRSERRDSRADFYTSQARAEPPQLQPRPSMPSTSAKVSAQAELSSEAGSSSSSSSSSSRSSGTDGVLGASGEALQGASRNGTGGEPSSSGSQPEQPSTSSRATADESGQPQSQPQSQMIEPPSQSQSNERSGAPSSSSQPQSQSQPQDSSSSSSNSGADRTPAQPVQGGVQALGSFFSRVMAPLSNLGSAFQQRQQQLGLGGSSSSSSSSSSRDSERDGGSASSNSRSSDGGEVGNGSTAADRRTGASASTSASSSASGRGEREALDFVPTKQDMDGSAVIDLEDILSNNSSSSSSSTAVPPAPRTNRVASTFQSLFGRRGARAKEGRAGVSGGLEDEANEDGSQGGVYMYGAIVLALHGEVVLDTVTSMGYRAPSPCIWRIEGVTSKNEIVSIAPEAISDAGGSSSMGSASDSRGNLLGSSGRGPSSRSSLLEDSSDEEYDDSELSELFAGSPEVQAITAVVDMLDGLGDEGIDQWSEILDGAAVAIAPDSSKRAHELGPDDWELLPLVDILEEYGVLKVGNSPVLGGGCDLRPGHRMKLMVRDSQGVREGMSNAMLRYKRNNLGAMMSGTNLPPTFGTLLLTDVDRGIECYGMPHHESRIAHSYVPAPLAGIFGGAQIGPLKGGPGGGNGSTGILENSAVLGVLRAATDKSPAAVKRQADAKAEAVKQQKEWSEGGASASAGSTDSSRGGKGEDGESGEERRSEEGKK